jgi:DNA-binding MarR family transcriptional regulator
VPRAKTHKAAPLPDELKALLHIDRQLCFLLYRASGRMTKVYRPILEPLGLTYPQYLVMLVLWTDSPRSVGDLGRALELEIGTLSPLLKRMEAAGLIARTRDPKDERRVSVALTQAGRALQAKALERVPKGLACAIKLPIDELVALHGGLNRLLDTLDVGER